MASTVPSAGRWQPDKASGGLLQAVSRASARQAAARTFSR
jgi:hypothetical protein